MTMAKEAQTIKDLQNAETDIICFIQGQSFHNELYILNGGEHLKRISSILKLDPVFDNGILRIEGHVCKSAMPTEVKPSAIKHERIRHCERKYMLSQLHEKFWVPQAIRLISVKLHPM